MRKEVSRISDGKAATMCKRLIGIAIKKGVVMRPGSYVDTEFVENKKGKEVEIQFACALGSIEHALARGEEFASGWKNHESLRKKANHGISLKQLYILESGFENQDPGHNLLYSQAIGVDEKNPLYKLGKSLRKRARDILRKRFPENPDGTFSVVLPFKKS